MTSETRKFCKGPVWEALVATIEASFQKLRPVPGQSVWLTRDEAERVAYLEVRKAYKRSL